MPPEPPPFQLQEPDAIEALLPGWWLPPILLGCALFLVLLLVVFLLVRHMRRPRVVDPAKVREETRLKAVATLEAARGSAATAREAAVLASLVLRNYLASAAGDPALFETHEEFIARHDSLAALTEKARAAAAAGFSRLAALKYSAQPPDTSAQLVIESARTLLDELHRGFSPT